MDRLRKAFNNKATEINSDQRRIFYDKNVNLSENKAIEMCNSTKTQNTSEWYLERKSLPANAVNFTHKLSQQKSKLA